MQTCGRRRAASTAAQKVLEKTASRAGEATAEGQIVPANLRNTVAAENRGAYARGEGEFSGLARAGAGVMAPLPNSGTGQRNIIWDVLNGATLGAGAGCHRPRHDGGADASLSAKPGPNGSASRRARAAARCLHGADGGQPVEAA
jgi:hypothetical protein